MKLQGSTRINIGTGKTSIGNKIRMFAISTSQSCPSIYSVLSPIASARLFLFSFFSIPTPKNMSSCALFDLSNLVSRTEKRKLEHETTNATNGHMFESCIVIASNLRVEIEAFQPYRAMDLGSCQGKNVQRRPRSCLESQRRQHHASHYQSRRLKTSLPRWPAS